MNFQPKTKIYQCIGASILIGALATFVTNAQASTANVQVLVKNTIGTSVFYAGSNEDGYISAFRDHALPPGGPVAAITRTEATANLASGSLQAYALAHSSHGASAYAQAAFHEVLTFSPNPGVSVSGSDWITADISMSAHAIKSAHTGLTGAPNNIFASLSYFGRDDDFVNLGFSDVDGLTQVQQTLIMHDVKIYYPDTNLSPEIHLSAVLGAYANASFRNQPLVDGEYYAQFDAGNTAVISIDLPEGFSFESQSGLFLTSPVPIPAAAWLFGSALLGLGAIKRMKA